jgi:small subunit ribosomal protein S2e
MSEQRGFGNNRGSTRGRGRGGARGGAKGGPKGGPQRNEARWRPLTKLGRLVNSGQIKSLEEIFKFSMPIKEVEIVDKLIGESENFKEEVMKVKPVQKQTTAGQRTRFKVWVLIGDGNGHIGLGQKAHKEVQGAIKGAIRDAKMNIVPVRMGYWGNNIAKPHTIPMKISGKEGSVTVRLVPAPRGTGIVGGTASKKVLQMAGVLDCYTQTSGKTRTKGNFLFATFKALSKTYSYVTPEFWGRPCLDNVLFDNQMKNKKDEEEVEEELEENDDF